MMLVVEIIPQFEKLEIVPMTGDSELRVSAIIPARQREEANIARCAKAAALYQGIALVVPPIGRKEYGFSPG